MPRPAMTLSTAAASATERACTPTVSWLGEIGTTPSRLVRPAVGLMPTTPQTADGQTMEPSVSVPRAAVQSSAATAAAEPELEPQGLRSRTCGLRHCPPTALQPLSEALPRKLA